jgi:hypothetical protein
VMPPLNLHRIELCVTSTQNSMLPAVPVTR